MKYLVFIFLLGIRLLAMDTVAIDIQEKPDTTGVVSLKQQVIRFVKKHKIGCARSDKRFDKLRLEPEELTLLENIAAYNHTKWDNAHQAYIFAKDINDKEKESLCQKLILKKATPLLIDKDFLTSVLGGLLCKCWGRKNSPEYIKRYFNESVAFNIKKFYPNHPSLIEYLDLKNGLAIQELKYVNNRGIVEPLTVASIASVLLTGLVFGTISAVSQSIT